MTFIFKIRIYDKHERQYFVDGEERTEPISDEWGRFDYYIDLNKVQITSFREYVLFDSEGNPTRCIKIFLSDDSWLYGSYSIEKFVELYTTEYSKIYDDWNKSIGDLSIRTIFEEEEPEK